MNDNLTRTLSRVGGGIALVLLGAVVALIGVRLGSGDDTVATLADPAAGADDPTASTTVPSTTVPSDATSTTLPPTTEPPSTTVAPSTTLPPTTTAPPPTTAPPSPTLPPTTTAPPATTAPPTTLPRRAVVEVEATVFDGEGSWRIDGDRIVGTGGQVGAGAETLSRRDISHLVRENGSDLEFNYFDVDINPFNCKPSVTVRIYIDGALVASETASENSGDDCDFEWHWDIHPDGELTGPQQQG